MMACPSDLILIQNRSSSRKKGPLTCIVFGMTSPGFLKSV